MDLIGNDDGRRTDGRFLFWPVVNRMVHNSVGVPIY